MQSSTHLEPSAAPVASVSTHDLRLGDGPPEPGRARLTRTASQKPSDEPAPRQADGIPDPQSARQLADNAAEDEGTLWEGQPSTKTFIVQLVPRKRRHARLDRARDRRSGALATKT